MLVGTVAVLLQRASAAAKGCYGMAVACPISAVCATSLLVPVTNAFFSPRYTDTSLDLTGSSLTPSRQVELNLQMMRSEFPLWWGFSCGCSKPWQASMGLRQHSLAFFVLLHCSYWSDFNYSQSPESSTVELCLLKLFLVRTDATERTETTQGYADLLHAIYAF